MGLRQGTAASRVNEMMVFVIGGIVFVAVKSFVLQLDCALANIKGVGHGLRADFSA